MSQKTVTKAQFKANALEYLRHVEASGESIVITDNGRPTFVLRPYQSDKPTLTDGVSLEGGLGPAFKLLGEMPSDFMEEGRAPGAHIRRGWFEGYDAKNDAETCSDFDELKSEHDPNKR